MNRGFAAFTIIIVIALLSSVFVVTQYSIPTSFATSTPFYVGIEFGYGNASDCYALVDKVKNYTNLLVISSTNITQNQALLNQTCDYAVNAGLHVMVYFPQSDPIFDSSGGGGGSYHAYLWAMKAKDKYGDYFLGSYIYDEPGGEVLDKAPGAININYITTSGPGQNNRMTSDYLQASNVFVANAHNQMEDFLYCAQKSGTSVVTADYGLYWFDYKAGFNTVFAEFGWGNNRQMAIALCRGAATAQNKDWGAIICWENRTTANNQIGKIEDGPDLYNDLTLAYENGAKYAVIFDYAGKDKVNNRDLPNPYKYGILTDEHFDALQNFWNYIQQNPGQHGSKKADIALVLPQGFGFGFRSIDDKIWGLEQTDNWTTKMWNDVNNDLNLYGSRLDIVYSDPEFQAAISKDYSKVIPWKNVANQEDYPVINLNNSLGYTSIQKAVNSWSTLNGDTIYVKPGIYNENLLIINKAVSLVGENKDTTIIDGRNKGTALTIGTSNVTVTGFTIRNGNTPTFGPLSNINSVSALIQYLQSSGVDTSQMQSQFSQLNSTMVTTLLNQFLQVYGSLPTNSPSSGILLRSASNCTLTGNVISNSTYGIQLLSSANNTLGDNDLIENKYGIGVSGSTYEEYLNKIDDTNTVNGKPVYFWTNKNNMNVPEDAGYVALIDCVNITVQNLHLSGNAQGLMLINTHNSTITGNKITNNYEGIIISNSSDNILHNNKMTDNEFNLNYSNNQLPNRIDNTNTVNDKPVYILNNQQNVTIPVDAGYVALINCNNIVAKNLNLSSNAQGITLVNTSNSIISQSVLTKMTCAIQIVSGKNNQVDQNVITASKDGIALNNSANNDIENNLIADCPNTGITLVNSFANNLQKNTLIKNNQGILLKDSSRNTLTGNIFSSNINGLQLNSNQAYYSYNSYSQESPCSFNTIIENNFTQNQCGINIASPAFNNTFYHNNINNNTQQVNIPNYYSSTAQNKWDNGSQGNYWSNYNGTDAHKDGIGDQPFYVSQQYQTIYTGGVMQKIPISSSSDVDNFPLMKPFSTN